MHEPAHLTRRALAAVIPFATIAGAVPAAASLDPAQPDPVYAQIALHRILVRQVNDHPGADDDPSYEAAVREEEAAIQALGDMKPTTITAAVAQLEYMAEAEGTFATGGSPLLRCVLTVAKGLSEIQGGLPS